MELKSHSQNQYSSESAFNDQNSLRKKKAKIYTILVTSFLLTLSAIIIIIFASKKTFKSNNNIKASNDENLELGENNIFINVIKAKYISVDKTSKMKIINVQNKDLNIKLFIDGNEVPFSEEYLFNESRTYDVEFKFNEELKNLSSLFENAISLREIDFSRVKMDEVTSLEYLFYRCTFLQKVFRQIKSQINEINV